MSPTGWPAISRRDFLKAAGTAAGVLALGEAGLAIRRLAPIVVANPLESYPDRGWEEVYRDWQSDELKFYWERKDLRVARFDTTYFANRDREAFALAERGDPIARAALLRIAQRDPDPDKRERAHRALERLERLERALVSRAHVDIGDNGV